MVSYDEDAYLESHDEAMMEETAQDASAVVYARAPAKWPTELKWLKSDGEHANPHTGRLLVSCLLWVLQNLNSLVSSGGDCDEETDDWDVDCDSVDWPKAPPQNLWDIRSMFYHIFDEFENGDLAVEPDCEDDDNPPLLCRLFYEAPNIMGAAWEGVETDNREGLRSTIVDLCNYVADVYRFKYQLQ